MNIKRLLLLLSIMLFFTGCAGTVKNMRVIPAGSVVTTPQEGKSVVVFMRPSTLGFAIQSSVFEIKDKTPVLAGIIAAKKKFAYQLEPGKHLFMVVGESADFMYAELEANKTYYTLVTPRMGLWKARFSLKPVHFNELKSSDFNTWLHEGEWVESSPDSYAWAKGNSTSIRSKYEEYYEKWINKSASDRPKLLPDDGK